MKIAVVQLAVIDGEPAQNRQALSRHLDAAAGGDLYIAPELWTTGYVQPDWARIADDDTPASLAWMGEQARSRNIWLGGSLIARTAEGALANRFVLFDRSGALACHYDKAHLFRPLREDEYLTAGNVLPPIVEAEGVRIAPAICYDLRFPEMFRRLALKDVDLFVVPSEWPFPREHALRIMTEARAVENQAFVALANRVGLDSHGNNFCGGSGIFGPQGALAEVLGCGSTASADIDVKKLHDLRASFPVLSHRLEVIDHD